MIAKVLSNGLQRMASTTIDPVHPKDPALRRLFGLGTNTPSGMSVDESTSLSLPGVYRGIVVIANAIMRNPLNVYMLSDSGREIDKDHPARKLLKPAGRVNEVTKSGQFQRTLQIHANWWGNGLAHIERDNAGRPISLTPLLPDRSGLCRVRGGAVSHDVDNCAGQLMYYSRIGGQHFKFLPENVLHICGPSLNGVWGLRIVELMRNSLGGHMATDQHGQRLFGQGANIAGFVSIEGSLDDEEQLERFEKSLQKATSGLNKAHRLVALEEGAKFQPMTMTNEDAQFLASKNFNRAEQALIVGVQSSKVGDRHQKSYNSLEMENQEHASDDICPWMFTWYEECTQKLLTEEQKEKESHEIDFDDSNLQWVSYKDRILGAEKALNAGLVDQDEGRAMINHPPGKNNPNKGKYRKPMNIGYEGDPEGNVRRGESMAQGLAQDALESILLRLSKQAQSHTRNGGGAFVDWLDSLETSQGSERIQSVSIPMVEEFQQTLNGIAETTTEGELVGVVSTALADMANELPEKYAKELNQ